MTLRPLLLLCALVAALSACKKDDDPFLPLPAICPQRSESICAAREYFCDSEPDPSCQKSELEQCEELIETFESDAQLGYDSVAGSRVRNEEQAALDQGEAAFPLARYFSGGFSVDAECERDSQCKTGVCDGDTGRCAEPEEVPLCEPE